MGLAVKPLRRERHMFRWCVKGSRGSVTAVFDSRRRTVLVATTAGGHGNRGVRPGTAIAQVKRAYGPPWRTIHFLKLAHFSVPVDNSQVELAQLARAVDRSLEAARRRR